MSCLPFKAQLRHMLPKTIRTASTRLWKKYLPTEPNFHHSSMTAVANRQLIFCSLFVSQNTNSIAGVIWNNKSRNTMVTYFFIISKF